MSHPRRRAWVDGAAPRRSGGTVPRPGDGCRADRPVRYDRALDMVKRYLHPYVLPAQLAERPDLFEPILRGAGRQRNGPRGEHERPAPRGRRDVPGAAGRCPVPGARRRAGHGRLGRPSTRLVRLRPRPPPTRSQRTPASSDVAFRREPRGAGGARRAGCRSRSRNGSGGAGSDEAGRDRRRAGLHRSARRGGRQLPGHVRGARPLLLDLGHGAFANLAGTIEPSSLTGDCDQPPPSRPFHRPGPAAPLPALRVRAAPAVAGARAGGADPAARCAPRPARLHGESLDVEALWRRHGPRASAGCVLEARGSPTPTTRMRSGSARPRSPTTSSPAEHPSGLAA